MKNTVYEQRYLQQEHYWGNKISEMALDILEMYSSKNGKPKILEIGCGEGSNAVFLAKNGYEVSALDLSKTAVEKTKKLADKCEVQISTFIADLNDYIPDESFERLS